jgi:hypothetical protein
MEVAMTKQVTALAIAALLSAPWIASAETAMTSEALQGSTMMGDSQGTAEVENGETIKAEVVDVNGERVITESENGEQMVFFLEGLSGAFNVGDELEVALDHQSKTAMIVNVFPRKEEIQI